LIHEINNPINYVSGNVDPLIRNLNDFEEWLTKSDPNQSGENLVKETVDESKLLLNGIKEGAERVKELMLSLKSLSQPDKSDSVLFNLNNGIKSTVNLLRPTVKDRIDFQLDLGDLVEIQCNPGQIQQVFLNILDNAIDAIEKSGVIEIQSFKKEGRNIIMITDNGKGISNDNLNRIFEPFYTTKEFGHGSGLGLSISKRIMSEHNGEISVESNPGKTTSVTISFKI
jgi:signal transduction histidine kinase